MGIVSLLFSQFGVFLNSKLERKKFYIDDKWTIELPPDWEKTFLEIELDNSPIFETIFFQPGSDLGIGVYYLNFLKDDNYRIVEADIQEVATVFEEIMDKYGVQYTGIDVLEKLNDAYPKKTSIRLDSKNNINIIFIKHSSCYFSPGKWHDFLKQQIPEAIEWLNRV